MYCGSPEQVTLRYTSVVCKLFWVKGNFSHRLKRNFYLFLNHLKELAPNKRLSKITSFYLSIGQNKLLFTKHLFFLSSCNDPLMLWRHLTSSLAQDILYTDGSLSIPEPFMRLGSLSCMQGSIHMYVLNLIIFPLLIILMSIWLLDRPEEPQE